MSSRTNENDTKHLKLRGNVWWYQRRVPKSLQHIYKGDTQITFSLHTGDIRLAKSKRDQFNGELASKELSSTNPDAAYFRHLVRQFKADKNDNPRDWDAPYDTRAIEHSGNQVWINAYTTVTGANDKSHLYEVSLREALHNWQEKHGVNKSKETQRRVPATVKLFLNFLEVQDVGLQAINRRDVYDFIEYLAQHCAKNTVSGHISRLGSVWKLAKDRSDVTGDNPFKGHEIYGTHDTEKYQMLEPDELQRLVKAISSHSLEERLIFLLALYTGARCGEICNLRVGDVMHKGDYLYYYIDKGKTDAATRNVPIPEHLHSDIETICKDRGEDESLFGLSEKKYGRTFSKLKLKTLGESKGKAFHSLRVGFITALKRCDVREVHAAEICGHSKRGNTMSYGYYAKENEIKVLAEQCAKAVDYIKNSWLRG